MRILNSRFYQLADTVANYFLLNLLYFLVCLPIVTIFPATVALFSVVRAWRVEERSDIIVPFFAAFRHKLGRSLLLGIGWTIAGIVLFVDFLAVRGIPGAMAIPVLFALGLVAILYCQMSVHLYPTIAHIDARPRDLIRATFLLTLSQPFLSLFAALGLLVLAIATYFFPFMPVIVASSVAQALEAVFRRGVARFAPGALRGEIAELDPPIYPEEDETLATRR